MKRNKLRSFISVLVGFTFSVAAVTGVVLWLMPHGGIAGLNKGIIKEIHIWISLLMVVGATIHLILNWSIFVSYLRKASIPVGVLTLAVAVGASLLGGWDHGGRLTVQTIAERSGQPVEKVIAALAEHDISVSSPTASLLDLARTNQVAPPKLMAVVKEHWPQAIERRR